MRQKLVEANKRFGFRLEVDLLIFIQVVAVKDGADIQEWVELVPFGSANEERHELLHLLLCVHLEGIERVLQIVEAVKVGPFAEDGCLVIIIKSVFDSIGTVDEIQDKGV